MTLRIASFQELQFSKHMKTIHNCILNNYQVTRATCSAYAYALTLVRYFE